MCTASYVSRHVVQLQLTSDGNFQLNQYKKGWNDEDAEDTLWDGCGYFPTEVEFAAFMRDAENVLEVSNRVGKRISR